MAADLSLGILTDVHAGPPFEAKAGPRALHLLRAALADLVTARPALVLDLGDRINNDGRDADLRHMRAVAQAFRTADLEIHHLSGNHDLKALSADENAELLAAPVHSRVIQRGGWDLVLWAADPRVSLDGFAVPQEDLEWLDATLAAGTAPAAVFSHVPLGGGSMVGNYYFEGGAHRGASYHDLGDIHDVLLAHARLRLAVAGHVHWNSLHTVDGVPFVTIQSLSDLATTAPEPAAAWALLDLDDERVRVRVRGRDRWELDLPLRANGRRWLVRPELRGLRRTDVPTVDLGAIGGIVVDLDGVVYAGDAALPGAAEFLDTARSLGIRLVAVTNHAGRTATGVAEALAALGVAFHPHEVLTSIDAVISHLVAHDPGARVRVVGSHALRSALEAAGFGDAPHPDVVVASAVDELDASSLLAAAEAIAAGADFIATNGDRWLPRPAGRRVAEAGPVLAYLQALSGVEPRVIGKPSRTMASLAFARLGLEAQRVLWVGDTLDTDIAGANAAGAASALVLTGNTAAARAYRPRPDLVVGDLVELRRLLVEARRDPSAASGEAGSGVVPADA